MILLDVLFIRMLMNIANELKIVTMSSEATA